MNQNHENTNPNSAGDMIKRAMAELQAPASNEDNDSAHDSPALAADHDLAFMKQVEQHAGTPGAIETPRWAGAWDRIRAAKERQTTQLEAMKIHWKGQLERLTNATNAGVEESRAFWNARSAEICEKIKAYAQSNIHDLSNEIQAKRQQAIANAGLSADRQVKSIANTDMDETIKQHCITRIMADCFASIQQIEDNTIAKKYGLAD